MTIDGLCAVIKHSFEQRIKTASVKDIDDALQRMKLWEACQTYFLAELVSQKENEP